MSSEDLHKNKEYECIYYHCLCTYIEECVILKNVGLCENKVNCLIMIVMKYRMVLFSIKLFHACQIKKLFKPLLKKNFNSVFLIRYFCLINGGQI